MKGHQSWVTYADNDEEGIKALILARSLTTTITRRLLTIFVSYAVSEELLELLDNEFDRCITIYKTHLEKYDGLPFSQVAMINCYGLSKLEKFVFIDCNCIVLVNSDELFKYDGIIVSKDDGEIITKGSLIVGSPSDLKLQQLKNQANSRNNSWTVEKMMHDSLNKNHNIIVDVDGNKSDLNFLETKIVRFSKSHPIDILSNDNNDKFAYEGVFEQALFDKFMEFLPSEIISKYLQTNPRMIKKLNELLKSVPPGMNFKHLGHLQNSIAIVGISCRFPGANNLDEFWDLLINGKEGIIKVPEGRWKEDHSCFRNDIMKETEAGFLTCPIDQIDAKFFGLSPIEVSYMDPQQRLTLQVIWEAIEHAGIHPNSLKNSKTGVFGGWWRNDYKEMLQESGINEQEFFRTYMGNALGTLTGRISHVLELTGPSISTESGCSTSIVAVDMACKSLLNENCDVGLAFGVNLLLHPFSPQILNSVIAMDGRCKTFDAKADGFGRAEGCSVLVLKRYSDAMRDGNRVWGLIRGSAVVQEGPSRSMGTPTVQCESLAMERALADARVNPKDVSFVETHGTGTPIGDPLEVAAISKIYSKDRENALVIGSVKTNIGHTESCSGIAGIIKTILALQHQIIPPHRNFETLNPEIDLETIPAIIPLTPYKWEANPKGKPRIAGVSSFGITGTDAHVIIQETPKSAQPGLTLHSDIPLHLLKTSAKSSEALKELQTSYKAFLEMTEEDLTDICYTASIGRGDFAYKSVVVGYDKSEILKNLIRDSSQINPPSGDSPKICFLFTGQGSQYPGMAKALYDHSPLFKMHFDNCDQLLMTLLGISIKNSIWGDKTDDLNRTIYSQTSIFCIEYCLLKLWESWGIKPDVVLGHSLGEFAAAVAAGILTFADALTLVAERSRLIDNLPSGKMLVIKECQEKVDLLLKTAFTETTGWLDYAAINSEEQTVLAGSEQNILKFAEFCINNNIKTHVLQSTHAFHSRHMEPILDEYRKTATKIKYAKAKCSFISGMDGNMKEDGEVDAEYWVRHTREPVRFLEASKAVLASGNKLFLEVGPQPVLSALIMANADTLGFEPQTCLPSMRRNEENWSTILNSLENLYKSGVEVNWKQFHQFSGGKIVTLPFYPFQNKSYWFDVNKGGRQRPIHPLVGTPVPNASQTKLFQNELNLLNTTYLKDHVIGTQIIMPGAGFLEMCLVAGQAAYQGSESGYLFPSGSVTIKDFFIEEPLALNEIESTQTQLIVTTENTGETRVTIYSKCILDKETSKWIRHASGIFHPYAVQDLETNDTLENVKSLCPEKLSMGTTYNKFQEHGLTFGPTFKNLVAKNKGERDVYFEISQPNVNTDDYIVHPVIIDAMLQAIYLVNNSYATQLHVPISITKFIWHAKLSTRTSYVHVYKHSDEEVAVLYDKNGQRIATVFGTTFLPTNVSSVNSAVEAQRLSLPSMYQEVWRHQLGPWEKRVPNLSFNVNIYEPKYKEEVKYKYNSMNEEQYDYYLKSNELSLLYIIRALKEAGWNLVVGETSSLNQLLTTLRIMKSFKRMTRYMLTILAEDGYLETMDSIDEDDFRFKVINTIPSGDELSYSISKLYLKLNPDKTIAADSVATVANSLGKIFSGEQSAISILSPEGRNEIGAAEQHYNKSIRSSSYKIAEDIFPIYLQHLQQLVTKDKKVLRILEVGAGTGSFTKVLLKSLNVSTSAYEYTYTDISPVFFSNAENIFKNNGINVIYKTLNIEEDPTLQGFIPQYYDLICASFVIHATKDVRKSMSMLRNLLRPGGDLLIMELTKPLREMNLVFGVLKEFWAFTDNDLRPHCFEMSDDKWENVLKDTGFIDTTTCKMYNNHWVVISAKASNDFGYIREYLIEESLKTWLVFSNDTTTSNLLQNNLSQIGRKAVIINLMDNLIDIQRLFMSNLEGVIYFPDLDLEYNICKPFLNLCQILVTIDNVKLLVVTTGILSMGDKCDHEIALPFCGPLIPMTKALKNENATLTCRCVDMDPNASLVEAINNVFSETFINEAELVVAYRGNQRHVCRFLPLKILNNSLTFPSSGRSRLILPSSNAIQDLRFGPALHQSQIGKNSVEIQVKAFSLNFRDLLVVLKPDAQFENFHTVGLDFSGVITAIGSDVTLHKIGDAVLGLNIDGDAFPSHLVLEETFLLPIPVGMTFNEAATLPAVALTAYLCLIEGNRLKENDTILIHTGSGGVGLCAIQVAKSLSCNIVATAGSARKQAYLKNLGIKHVFNSRNTDYGTQIRGALGGQGVDFVLNSLTGDGFKEATLALCKPGARFVEMSKLNIWTPEQVQKLRPDVQYEIIDASGIPEKQMRGYMRELKKYLDDSLFKPIPYVRFDASDIRMALNYLQKAKHIGKIICVMPESNGQKLSQELVMSLFNERSSYLITGGLGGIGIEIAKWMARLGAKHIVLVGRNDPKEKAIEEINILKSNGTNIIVMKCDVSDFSQCQSLLTTLKSKEINLPQLRGIMHAAGVLSDGLYENQTWEKYEEVFNPKIKGGWNLHRLTLDYPLEHFVMFSSISGIFGSLGQSNYSAANVFLDCLAHYRNSIGLSAKTVNWGQWSQVGMAAHFEVPGIKPMSPLQCVSSLEKIMRNHILQTCVCEADFTLLKKVYPLTKSFLSDLKDTHNEKTEVLVLDGGEFWKEYDTVRVDCSEVVKKYIRSAIRQILKIDENESIDDNGNLQNMGMDSLMTIEMKNIIQSLVGDRAKITVNSVKDCTSISLLASRIVELISGGEEPPPPTRDELNQLIREDAQLPLHIKPDNFHKACKPSQICTVLITGVTGNLGPYILKEILKRPHIQKVYCLMRSSNKNLPESRLKKTLSDKNMIVETEKVECIVGNVIQKQFGLDEEKYLKLTHEVDAVFHLAVKASFQEVYQKRPETDGDIRTVNVIGTKNILEFACIAETKLVYHASASISVTKLDGDKRMSEKWPMIDDFDELPNDAYVISKFIADRLMAQAVECGLPCKVFRFPFIGGDSRTGGNISVLNNSLLLRMMSYMHLGIMPAISVPFMIIPVDQCAEISARIFFDDETGFEVYNVHNPKANDEQEIEDIAEELGYKVEIIDPDEFNEKISLTENSELLIMIKKFAENTQQLVELFEGNTLEVVEAWITGNKKVFLSKKLERLFPEYPDCMEPSLDILKRDLWHAKNSGLFTNLGV